MPDQTVNDRVEILEQRVQLLETLPGRVEALEVQIVQLRNEMRGEFSAIRQDLRHEIRQGDEETRRYMRILHEEVISRIAMLGEGRNTP